MGERVPTADQRVVMYNAPWSRYEAELALRGEAPVPRLAYLEATPKLMRPSKDHERIKSCVGWLVEAYAVDRGIDLTPYGSWTLKSAPRTSGAEPDECYLLGADQTREVPDLVIEVIWTSGGIEKLEIYRRLGVREVWFWRDGKIEAHVLGHDSYQRVSDSAVLPGLDLNLMVSFLDQPTATQAVRVFQSAIRPSGS